jgi:predicted protein tyrosine phosphatase
MPYITNVPRNAVTSPLPPIPNSTRQRALISISDFADDSPDIEGTWTNVLPLHFDDTEDPSSPRGCRPYHATRIAQFLLRAKEQNLDVVVHCMMGMYRSGAVVAVAGELGFDYAPIPEVSPPLGCNELVFSRVSEVLIKKEG